MPLPEPKSFALRLYLSLEDNPPFGSKRSQEQTWKTFLEKGTNHSDAGIMVAQMLLRAECERIPYRLTRVPGGGYWLEVYKEPGHEQPTP